MGLAASQEAAALPNIHSLTPQDRKAHMRREFSGQSRFQREFGQDALDLDCMQAAQALRDEVVRLLNIKGVKATRENLDSLHEILSDDMKVYNYDDGVNKVSTLLYDTDAQFETAYHHLLKAHVAKHFPYPFYFQKTVTVRIHCPGGKNANHYPRYHTDIGYGHPPQEINLWIPLTEPKAPQLHGFRRMNVEDSRRVLETFDYDFTPFIEKAINDKPYNRELDKISPQVATQFGRITAFDSRCIHTGEPMENHTRISMDVRIIPVADYEAMTVAYKGTGRRRILYRPGDAYHPQSSDQL